MRPPLPIGIVEDQTPANAGVEYQLMCEVEAVEGLVYTPQLEWNNARGDLTSVDGVAIGNQTTIGKNTIRRSLTFNPLKTSHGGSYTCTYTWSSGYMTYSNSSTHMLSVGSKNL